MRKNPDQLTLPGIPAAITTADIRAFVRDRLHGFQLRNQARAEKRRKQNTRKRKAAGTA